MAEHAPLHVLVVDDDGPSRRLAARVLGMRGYRVTTRPWPDLGPSEVASLRPDAVVLELRFGGRPLGLELLEALKADPATAGIPVVVCSADAYGLRGAARRLAESGCDVVPKPYRAADLAEAVAGRVAAPHQAA